MTAFERLIAALEPRGTVKRTAPGRASARCPAHDDASPSLSITRIEGAVLMCCHAGCTTADVLAALSMTMADLYDEPKPKRVAGIAAHAVYRYDNGREVIRSAAKEFRQANTDTAPELYRLERVRAAVAAGRPVFVVEGEKDVLALEAVGVTATCSPMGAGKWSKVDPSPLYDAQVLVIVDQDEPGRAHALEVVTSLAGRANVATFAPKIGKDAADHIAAGYGVADLTPVELFKAGSAGSAGSTSAGSAGCATTAGSPERVPVTGAVLDEAREWLDRFICTVDDTDLDLLTLWAAHTHLCLETYTTPRLVLDSPVPGSGKTTVLEHLERLCLHPVQMASLSSPALLTRMLDAGTRTILIDEADRSLSPDKDGVGELLAVLNSGYKRGGTRPVLVPIKGGGWDAKEMPTFAPVAMAGNNPNLPDDTKSRSIRVLLMPDIDGRIEDSDWELYDDDARALGQRLALWADTIRNQVRATRPELPPEIRGRARERWAPLKRVADAAGGRWSQVVDTLAVLDVQRIEAEREEGIVQQRPAVVLLGHLHQLIQEDEPFVATERLIDRLVFTFPDAWGDSSPFGKRLTPQRLGRMLVSAYNIHSARPEATGPRGYLRSALAPAFRRFGLDLSVKPAGPAEPAEPAALPAAVDFYAAFDAAQDDPVDMPCPMCGRPTRSDRGQPDLCIDCTADEIAQYRQATTA